MTEESPACVACASRDVHAEREINGFEIVACRACELRFVPPARLETVDYDELYRAGGDYDSHVTEADEMQEGALVRLPRARRETIEELRAAPPKTLLEVGCGVGNFLRWIEQMGVDCCGIDPSGNATEMARRSLSCPIETGFLTHETFPGRTFEVICFWEVLEHVSEVDAFMQVIHDRLAPGGRVYLSTPNYDSAYLWRDMPRDPRSRPPVHVTFWNPASLRSFMGRRFVATDIRTASVPLGPAIRSGGPLARWTVYADVLLRPSQRLTLVSRSRKAG